MKKHHKPYYFCFCLGIFTGGVISFQSVYHFGWWMYVLAAVPYSLLTYYLYSKDELEAKAMPRRR